MQNSDQPSASGKYKDRITIFNHLTLEKMNEELHQEKVKQILTDSYPQFAEFCDDIIHSEDACQIDDIYCYIENGCVIFEKRCSHVESIDIPPD